MIIAAAKKTFPPSLIITNSLSTRLVCWVWWDAIRIRRCGYRKMHWIHAQALPHSLNTYCMYLSPSAPLPSHPSVPLPSSSCPSPFPLLVSLCHVLSHSRKWRRGHSLSSTGQENPLHPAMNGKLTQITST